MGHPSREMLGIWVDELAPGQRKYRGPNPKKSVLPIDVFDTIFIARMSKIVFHQ